MLAKRMDDWETRFIERGRAEGLEQGLERGLEQGLEQGLKQGRVQGLNKGREDGIRSTLIRLIEDKFGRLSEQQLEKFNSADSEQLDQFLSRVLRAESIEDVTNGD